jgi:hypothetical protein
MPPQRVPGPRTARRRGLLASPASFRVWPSHGETAIRRTAMPARVMGLPDEAGLLSVMPLEMRAGLPAGAAARIMMSGITGRYHAHLPARSRLLSG